MHVCMSTKTITLAEDAYDRLLALKRERDSFSDVVRRLATRRSLTEFAGVLSSNEAAQVEVVVRAGRVRSRERAKKMKRFLNDL